MTYHAERIQGYLSDVLQSPPVVVGEYSIWLETSFSRAMYSGIVTITGQEPARNFHIFFQKKDETEKTTANFLSHRDALNAMAILIRAFEVIQGVELPEIKG